MVTVLSCQLNHDHILIPAAAQSEFIPIDHTAIPRVNFYERYHIAVLSAKNLSEHRGDTQEHANPN
jgi:hypothetical protein